MWKQKNKTPKLKPKPLTPREVMIRRQIMIGLVLVMLIALLLTAIWYVTRIKSLQVTDVEVVGGFTIPQELVRKNALSELSGTYFRLVPKQFVWLYPQTKIVASIESMDRVKQVEVTRDKQILHIAFEEYQPFALWCESVDSTVCWFVDHQGLAFARAPELTGNAFIRLVTDVAPAEGVVVAETSFIDESEDFIAKLEQELGVFVTHIIRTDELDVEYVVAGGGRIKLSQSIPLSESFNNLKAILRSPDFSHLEPGSFNYIDLRFGDKVFVNEVKEAGPVATSTASSTN